MECCFFGLGSLKKRDILLVWVDGLSFLIPKDMLKGVFPGAHISTYDLGLLPVNVSIKVPAEFGAVGTKEVVNSVITYSTQHTEYMISYIHK